MRNNIDALSDVPEHLTRIAKAALAVGMSIETYSVREETVLYADGSFFSPDTHDTHALSLIHRAVEFGLKRRNGWSMAEISTIHTNAYVTVKVGKQAGIFGKRDRQAERHRALRLAIVDALGVWYDRQIA